MKAHLLWTVVLTVTLGLPSAAWAQRRMPHTDANGLGVEVGVFTPRQSGFGTGLDIDGTLEHYIDARDSLRADVGWMQAKQNNDSLKSVREIRIGGDIVHNWEGGSLHPFVGAGLGVYFLQARNNGANNGDGATNFGGNLLGGLEFFTSKTFAVKAEARYHIVTKWNGYDPSGFALTVGLKSYF